MANLPSSQTRVSLPVQIHNTELGAVMTLTDFPDTAPVAGVYHIQVVANTNTILNNLQAVAPNANYAVMGVYNPYPTLLAIGLITGDGAIAQLNSMIRSIAIQHGAHFVDPLPVFNPSGSSGGPETGDVPVICALTGMCPGGTFNPGSPLADIHPSKQGYKALASLFESATGL